MVPMATREKSARNRAAADYLKSIKSVQHPRITTDELADRLGMSRDTLNRQLNNRAQINVDDFISIAGALGVSGRDALRALGEIVVD